MVDKVLPNKINKKLKLVKDGDPVITTFNYKMTQLVKSKWGIHLFGKDGKVIFYTPGNPNWFHRLMTKLLLGWHWEKVQDE